MDLLRFICKLCGITFYSQPGRLRLNGKWAMRSLPAARQLAKYIIWVANSSGAAVICVLTVWRHIQKQSAHSLTTVWLQHGQSRDSRRRSWTIAAYILQALACIYMDLRNSSSLISTSGHHWERDGGRQKPEPLDNWICCISSANQKAYHKHWIVFSAYTKWVVFCIVHCMTQSAMMAYINVQCILDCLPVSVSTEPVYSDDQFANSYSNPYKLIYQWLQAVRLSKAIMVEMC